MPTNAPPQPGSRQAQERSVQEAAWSTQSLGRGQADSTPPPEPMAWAELAVQSVHDNHLVCKMFDGTVAYGDPVNVAKDPELRAAHYDGKTIDGLVYAYTGPQARTVTKEGTSDSKDQVIIPKYHVPADGSAGFVGSIITAAPIPTRVSTGPTTSVWCQLREMTQRAFANVEGA